MTTAGTAEEGGAGERAGGGDMPPSAPGATVSTEATITVPAELAVGSEPAAGDHELRRGDATGIPRPASPLVSAGEQLALFPTERVRVRRHPSRKAIAIIATLASLTAATAIFAYLTAHDDSASNRYRHLDSAEIALVHRLDAQVTRANSEIRSLNADLAATQGHLATVANQRAKDLDLLKLASLVAGDQNTCINKVQMLGADLSSSLNTGQPSSVVVQSDANQVATVCEQAQQATEALQGTVNGQP